MKRILTALLLTVSAATALAKGDWRGKVVDEKGEPVAYANVALLSRADSTLISGTVTDKDGTYHLETEASDGILMVAMLGYRTQHLNPADGALVRLAEDATLLEGASVRAVRPKIRMTGEGLQTHVRGSVLEHAGTASDALSKTPGIIRGQSGLEVIGKGTPLIYINGRRVTDPGELDRLQSNEIQSIEVITNPGAQYAATVRAVVRIRTVRRKGEGFGFNLNASDAQSLRWARGNTPYGALNMNYHIDGVDLFAGLNGSRSTGRQESVLEKTSFGTTAEGTPWLFENKGDLIAEHFGGNLYGNAGVNCQIADRHFAGGKIEWGRTLSLYNYSLIHDNVFENGDPVDRLTTVTEDRLGEGKPYTLGANLYYNGLVNGKLGIDVNLDYYGSVSSSASTAQESSSMTHDASVSTTGDSDGKLFAAKAVFSHPVWKGQLQVGTEETFSRRSDRYTISGVDFPTSQAEVREDNVAGFATYGLYLPKVGQLSAGVRYEYVHYVYEDALNPDNNLVRDYGNWFPTVSYANAFGPLQMMFNYSAKTRRPDYSDLSGAIRYNNRYIWQGGNARLQPEFSHDVSLTAVWKFLTATVSYERTDQAFLLWSEPYGDEGVVLVRPRNIETPLRRLSAFVILTPTLGPWTLNYTFGVQPQWFTVDFQDPREPSGSREASFNGKPFWVARLLNTFSAGGGWQFELGGQYRSPGYTQNILVANHYFDLTAAVQKTLLRDGSLVLRLEGRDLVGLGDYDVRSDFGNHVINQTNLMDTQRVKFSLRYRFNSVPSKYRGTGAGRDQKARM